MQEVMLYLEYLWSEHNCGRAGGGLPAAPTGAVVDNPTGRAARSLKGRYTAQRAQLRVRAVNAHERTHGAEPRLARPSFRVQVAKPLQSPTGRLCVEPEPATDRAIKRVH